MAPSKKIKVVPPAEEPEGMPLPSDPKAVFLGGLFFLAVAGGCLIVARESNNAVDLRCRCRAAATASVALIGTFASTADARGAAPNLCAPWNDRRLRYGRFRPGPQLGRQAFRGHSAASGKAEFVREPVNTLQRFFTTVGGFRR